MAVERIYAGETFGTKGPFECDVHEAVRTPEGWREGPVVAVVVVERAWGAMHGTSRAMPAAAKALPGRNLYPGAVREVSR